MLGKAGLVNGDVRKSDYNEILAGPGGVKLKRSQEGLDTKL